MLYQKERNGRYRMNQSDIFQQDHAGGMITGIPLF